MSFKFNLVPRFSPLPALQYGKKRDPGDEIPYYYANRRLRSNSLGPQDKKVSYRIGDLVCLLHQWESETLR